jgi:formylglycine-generating enzyme
MIEDGADSEYSFFQPQELFLQGQAVLSNRYTLQGIQITTESGVFCRARDNVEERDLTLKLFPPLIARDPKCISDLQRACRRSLKLSHANIWRLYSLESQDGFPYLRLGLLPDATLRSLIGMKCNGERAKRILWQCLDTLRYAHDKNILHGDVRPVVFAIDKNDVLTTIEFGVSWTVTATLTKLTGKKAKGANLYTAPEFITGKTYDRSSEFYSLACVMYELLTDSPPFESGDLAYQHVHEDPEPLGENFHREYGPVCEFITAGLIKDPEKRLAKVGQVIAEHTSAHEPQRRAKNSGSLKNVMKPRNLANHALAALALIVTAFALGIIVAHVLMGSHDRSVLTQLGVGSSFSYIPGGVPFGMGDKAAGLGFDNLYHPVTITREFYIGQTEVSLSQYIVFLNETSNAVEVDLKHTRIGYVDGEYIVKVGSSASLPVTGIRWEDAQAFCEWLSSVDKGWQYRLPTEAEWECAARGGRENRMYPWGDELDRSRLNCSSDALDEVGRHQQGAFSALFDIVGNAAEWVSDFYDKDYYSRSPAYDPKGPPQGNEHVIRGGSFKDSAVLCRVDTRRKASEYPDISLVGFRLLKEKLSD